MPQHALFEICSRSTTWCGHHADIVLSLSWLQLAPAAESDVRFVEELGHMVRTRSAETGEVSAVHYSCQVYQHAAE